MVVVMANGSQLGAGNNLKLTVIECTICDIYVSIDLGFRFVVPEEMAKCSFSDSFIVEIGKP